MAVLSSRKETTPIDVIRSNRMHETRVLTSLPAGKMVPLHYIPLLREDQIASSTMKFSFEMMETVELLMNSVLVNVKAYLVPHLAYKRFSGMDELNRSFAGQPNQEGGAVTPYFLAPVQAGANPGYNPIHDYMGIHTRNGEAFNLGIVDAYNEIWNFRARNRSPNIPLRADGTRTLAPAFWQHEMFSHMVPDFDQAIIDGEVSLNVVASQLAVKSVAGQPIRLKNAQGTVGSLRQLTTGQLESSGTVPPGTSQISLDDVSNIYAEMTANGITVSLSNIEMARKTQAFAKLREQFHGHSDEYIIDMLMDGLTVPEQAFRQPILLGEQFTVFGQSKRYASDAANLTKSVTNGMTTLEMRIRCPRVPMGGIIMFVAEVTPEQLFERQEDPYISITDPEKLPHYLRDTLDPEKVQVVKNRRVDMAHATPDGTFGYEPLNAHWNYTKPNIGGKFFRPAVNTAFDEERQRIWAVETANPTLSADFYLCNTMHQKAFVVTNKDPFEVVVRGSSIISGNTVFGAPLIEGTNDWDETVEEIDQTRIVK